VKHIISLIDIPEFQSLFHLF